LEKSASAVCFDVYLMGDNLLTTKNKAGSFVLLVSEESGLEVSDTRFKYSFKFFQKNVKKKKLHL